MMKGEKEKGIQGKKTIVDWSSFDLWVSLYLGAGERWGGRRNKKKRKNG